MESSPRTPRRVESISRSSFSTIRHPQPSGGTSPDLEAPEYEYVDGTKPKEKLKEKSQTEKLNQSFGLEGQPKAAIVFGVNNFLILVCVYSF